MNFKFAKVKTDEICRFFSYTRKGSDIMPNIKAQWPKV